MRVSSTLVVASLLAASAGCRTAGEAAPAPAAAGRPTVATSFYPATYFTERIAGERVEVVCPCPDDADPISWMPPAEAVARYQQADLIVVNGAHYERWLDKVSLPDERLVRAARPLEGELIRYADAIVHVHGPAGRHAHEGIDGHTWLDPLAAKAEAREIHRALVARLPGSEAALDEGLASLEADLDGLDERLAALAREHPEAPLLCSHPAYNYIGRRYGWRLGHVALDPARVPGEAQLAEVREALAGQPARIVLWESDPVPEASRRLGELGLRSVTFSPCETLSAEERAAGVDYLAIMRRNIDALEEALSQPGQAKAAGSPPRL